MPRRITKNRREKTESIKKQIVKLIKTMEGNSFGWIHGVNAKISSALQMSAERTHYYLGVLIREGVLVQKKKGSGLYCFSGGLSREAAPASAENTAMAALEKRREALRGEIESRRQKLKDVERLITLHEVIKEGRPALAALKKMGL